MSPRFLGQLRTICEQQESLLFKDNVSARLEGLKREAGHGMGRRVLENVVRLSKQEEVNVLTAVKAIERACIERLARTNWQMEEHTLRKSTVSRATGSNSGTPPARATCAASEYALELRI